MCCSCSNNSNNNNRKNLLAGKSRGRKRAVGKILIYTALMTVTLITGRIAEGERRRPVSLLMKRRGPRGYIFAGFFAMQAAS